MDISAEIAAMNFWDKARVGISSVAATILLGRVLGVVGSWWELALLTFLLVLAFGLLIVVVKVAPAIGDAINNWIMR